MEDTMQVSSGEHMHSLAMMKRVDLVTSCGHHGTRQLQATHRCLSVQVSREDEHLGEVAKWALDNVKRPLVIVRTFQPGEVPLNV